MIKNIDLPIGEVAYAIIPREWKEENGYDVVSGKVIAINQEFEKGVKSIVYSEVIRLLLDDGEVLNEDCVKHPDHPVFLDYEKALFYCNDMNIGDGFEEFKGL